MELKEIKKETTLLASNLSLVPMPLDRISYFGRRDFPFENNNRIVTPAAVREKWTRRDRDVCKTTPLHRRLKCTIINFFRRS